VAGECPPASPLERAANEGGLGTIARIRTIT
jgi:hypothetical protein